MVGDFMFMTFYLRTRTYLIIKITTTTTETRSCVLLVMTRKLLSLFLMTALTVVVVTFDISNTEKKLMILIFAENYIYTNQRKYQ
jgi:hypothetical protein